MCVRRQDHSAAYDGRCVPHRLHPCLLARHRRMRIHMTPTRFLGCAGLLEPSAGSVMLCGYDVTQHSHHTATLTGICPQVRGATHTNAHTHKHTHTHTHTRTNQSHTELGSIDILSHGCRSTDSVCVYIFVCVCVCVCVCVDALCPHSTTPCGALYHLCVRVCVCVSSARSTTPYGALYPQRSICCVMVD